MASVEWYVIAERLCESGGMLSLYGSNWSSKFGVNLGSANGQQILVGAAILNRSLSILSSRHRIAQIG